MVDDQIVNELQKKLDKLCNSSEVIKDNQALMGQDIVKIKEAVYNPEEGLYARLRTLETWKAQSSKMIWTLFTAVVGLVSAFLVKTL
tara:strand:+ start:310 stop:570 length:261 start_codon:yes stop_codon:yes gene_type:complete